MYHILQFSKNEFKQANTFCTMGNITNNDTCVDNIFQYYRINQIKCILKHFRKGIQAVILIFLNVSQYKT